MKSSELLISKIIEFEGLRLTAYKCAAGVPTIGIGHTKGVSLDMKITEEQAMQYLHEDLQIFEAYVNQLDICKTQGQFDALVDFAFNLGTGALGSSTLLKKMKQGAPTKDIQAEFIRWNKADGKILPGLTKRRQWEAERYAN
jgi:lysozyme